MAKRKRASLKDRSPDTLGLTSKKGKGMDLLFGGPLEEEPDSSDESTLDSVSPDEDLTGLIVEETPPTPTDATASPAGAAETEDYGNRAVDEWGLPVALDAPPDDLILASSDDEPAAASPTTGEADPVSAATSPFALPAEEPSMAPGTDPNDLSGIMDDDNSPIVEEETLANSGNENDLSGIVEDGSAASGSDDLTGIVTDDTLAGVGPSAPPDPANDFSGIMGPDEELAGMASAPPPATAAPIDVPASAYSPPPAPGTVVDTTPYSPPPAVNVPPPSTATGAPSLSPPRIVGIESVGGIAAEALPVSAEDILPQDALTKFGDHTMTVEKRERLQRDAATAEKIAKYIGPERRQKLDDEIMGLYDEVAHELSDNKDDAAFALKTLREAQEIVIEDISDYDDALYRVSVVRTMLVRKRNLRNWSYSWGMVVFAYAMIWMALFVIGILYIDPSDVSGLSEGAAALRSAWLSSLAGGIGGTIAILYSLSWRVAIKHEFDRQYIMKYLVQPVMGFVLGAVIFFITSAGFLLFNPSAASDGAEAFIGGPQLIAFQLLLGFIAGFRHRVVYYLIDRIVQKISPTATESKQPTSVVPSEDYERLSAVRHVNQ